MGDYNARGGKYGRMQGRDRSQGAIPTTGRRRSRTCCGMRDYIHRDLSKDKKATKMTMRSLIRTLIDWQELQSRGSMPNN